MRGAFALALVFAACSSYGSEDAPTTEVPGTDGGVDNDAASGTGADAAPLKCGDPGSQCVVVPSGWLLVSKGEKTCPAYFTDPRVLAVNARSTATSCTCTCGAPAGNPCLQGTFDVSLKTTTDCGDVVRTLATNGGACAALGASWDGTAYKGLSSYGAAPQSVTCPGTSAPPPIDADEKIDVCTSPAPTPCPDGACVAVPASVTACFVHDGDTDCPASAPTKKVLVVESEIEDQRTCAACSCTGTATSCSQQTLTLYSTSCSSGTASHTLGPMCVDYSDLNRTYYKYSATAVGLACAPTGAAPALTGTLKLPSAKTLCCK